MMEFDEMQKIWNEQKGENMYVINESALHKRIGKKKDAASKRISLVETLISLINGIVAIVLFVDALDDPHNWDFIGAAIMAATVIYIQYFRWKRKQAENTFDRSMLGELDHAISNTNHIVRFSYLMIIGYLVPMAIYLFAKMLAQGASIEKWALIIGLYLLSFLLIYWERKVCHIPRQKSLVSLKQKLVEE